MSEQTKHTDGPWEWRRVADVGCVVEHTLHGPDVLCRYWYDKPPSAHALMIAAAPDLLAALRSIAEARVGLQLNAKEIEAYRLVDAAIAKATGSTP